MTTQPTPEATKGAATSADWNARSYHAVSDPQFAWGTRVLDTLALAGDELVMDAGCGTGRLTALLIARVPRGHVVAVDRSAAMVRVARETIGRDGSRATVALADVSRLPFRAAFDVVFSTATFHWVLDHDALFTGLHAALRPGGRLHAQCGGDRNLHRIHERADALRATPAFATFFHGWSDPWEFATAETTRARLERAGFVGVQTSVEEAPVVFGDAAAFAAFVTTVVLRPYLARLTDERLRNAFVDHIVELAAADAPQFELDYWRLNIRAVRRG